MCVEKEKQGKKREKREIGRKERRNQEGVLFWGKAMQYALRICNFVIGIYT